ncbi:hypothetical protein INT43_007838 [Umbelopsis isabellina]|uniref:BHLH domain-containing protein n=1 Tax=Mortierella isabellina TaxID=91625 RepID=A0A8H7PQ14_MORIS|nr:hypothetical protein INT43_007838 [Umbelopsis isabellina]
MQYQTCPNPAITGNFQWQKTALDNSQLNWDLDESQIRPDYNTSTDTDSHQLDRSYSSDSTFSFHNDTSLEATYNEQKIKGEENGLSPSQFDPDNYFPPNKKRCRPDFEQNAQDPFDMCPSIVIPSSPQNRSMKTTPSSGVFSQPITPIDSPQDLSYTMLVQDALACFQPKPVNDGYFPTDQDIEPHNKVNRLAHNAIERRYRNNINDCLNELKNAVPALKFAKVKDQNIDDTRSCVNDGMDNFEELIDGVPVATKLNKATILRKATEYITHLKATLEQSESENLALQNLILQLPRGQEVVSYYRMQKQQFQVAEQERMAIERQAAFERRQREKREARRRSKMLRRGQSSTESRRNSSSSNSSTGHTFMALFLGLTYFSTTTFSTVQNTSESAHHPIGSSLYAFQSYDIWYVSL